MNEELEANIAAVAALAAREAAREALIATCPATCPACGKVWYNVFQDGNAYCTACIRSSKAANIANGATE